VLESQRTMAQGDQGQEKRTSTQVKGEERTTR